MSDISRQEELALKWWYRQSFFWSPWYSFLFNSDSWGWAATCGAVGCSVFRSGRVRWRGCRSSQPGWRGWWRWGLTPAASGGSWCRRTMRITSEERPRSSGSNFRMMVLLSAPCFSKASISESPIIFLISEYLETSFPICSNMIFSRVDFSGFRGSFTIVCLYWHLMVEWSSRVYGLEGDSTSCGSATGGWAFVPFAVIRMIVNMTSIFSKIVS